MDGCCTGLLLFAGLLRGEGMEAGGKKEGEGDGRKTEGRERMKITHLKPVVLLYGHSLF